MRIKFGASARREVRRAQVFYGTVSSALGVDFAAAVQHGVERIADSPAMWPPFSEGTRRYLLDRFPYALVYRVEPGVVRIVAVMHQARRPGYWQGR